MSSLSLVKLDVYLVVLGKMRIECPAYEWYVTVSHGSQSVDGGLGRETMKFREFCHACACRFVCKSHLDEFFDIDVSVEVLSCGKWSGQSSAAGVDSLPLVTKVDSASDFLDQERSKALGSELLVDAQEVNFSHINLVAIDNHLDWNCCEETAKKAFI